MLHTVQNGGRPPHAPYAPCTPQQLAANSYQYWALGHMHEFEVISTGPLIVFPGNLQGRNIRKCGRKGAVVVTVEDGCIVSTVRPIALDAVRRARVEIDVAGVEDEAGPHRQLRDTLGHTCGEHAEGRPLMVRVTIDGRTSMHGELHRRRDALREEVCSIALAISERLWVGKVVLHTPPPAIRAPADATLRDELSGLLAQAATSCSWPSAGATSRS